MLRWTRTHVRRSMEDPKYILEKAAEQRLPCEVLPRAGGSSRGELLRVERGGVVVLAPNVRLVGGEDVRVWFTMDGVPHTFEASVIRTGVPVPDRSQHGFLLGFLDGWSRGDVKQASSQGLDLAILPPNGPGVSLIHGPGRLVELTVDAVVFTLPVEHTMVFVAGGKIRFRFLVPGEEPAEVAAHVQDLVHTDVHLLYTTRIDAIEDAEQHRRLVALLQRSQGGGAR